MTAQAKGKPTLIATLLRRAEIEPDRIYGSFPLTDNVQDGFRDFTVGELARAVDVCAWLIETSFGLGAGYETLLYMGVGDFRYAIIFFAAIKCGYKVRKRVGLVQKEMLTSSRMPGMFSELHQSRTGQCDHSGGYELCQGILLVRAQRHYISVQGTATPTSNLRDACPYVLV